MAASQYKISRTSVEGYAFPFAALQLFGQGVLATLPLEGEEADDLFYRLSRLFEAWTGKDIQHYAATKE